MLCEFCLPSNPISIAQVQYAVENNFGGVMFWSLDLDDFTGRYCHQGKYPLLSKVKNVSETLAPNTVVDKITTPKVIVTKSTTSETVVSLNTTETLSSKAVDTIKSSQRQRSLQQQQQQYGHQGIVSSDYLSSIPEILQRFYHFQASLSCCLCPFVFYFFYDNKIIS